ncbi:uncharacterized protein SPPG_02263 [Spizellomyces punctatus DAOM BR117]|uniref:Uncharacterized protein n=1 Tax=Spizellomyces punctatus (strain DAOM BR117) TaxID=645134 RepID=A0A0L0HP76_SPIPD|nr:uncharacterized protein SPPG_02263 [Spizellomyces punctatus DAOM BR117]KND03206.1 hypothetical protein SPPG_02263 [Spizellomyces punctatus DAOM BR117]|eukprot:XP_016611245.1 hypothetical protein SPPG_02263 [Spizellomyces punctatus DAOM BR117]
MASRELTAGEECQQAAKTLSAFTDQRQESAIPPTYVMSAMGVAIIRGNKGVAVLRLKNGEWSAPCAIELENQGGTIQPGQETVLLFMTENAVLKLVSRALLRLGITDNFRPGPLRGNQPIDASVDVYGWVRFNGGFTPPELIASNMVAWFVREDPPRHGRWHGESVTWFDVLTNKITVDRSSVGNALYVVLNLAAGSTGAVDLKRKNFANVDSLTGIAPSITNTRSNAQQTQNPAASANVGGLQSSGYSNPNLMNNAYMQQQQQQLLQQQQLAQQQMYLQQQQQLQYQQQLLEQNQLAGFQQQPQQQAYYGMTTQAPVAYGGGQFSYEQALQQQALAHQQYVQQMQQQQNMGGSMHNMNPSQWNQ